ncbi:hypothetical protein DL762_010136 [Monosporascus cannonballus]|uniref:Uncharacterized protein n=1 Tax=Monosporascus cannonballus TaxID=155416 RepID=A0ABY0GS61_9PEZI|nr:hypothetical protein DL762_010136 [Monosporascus cannonballus]
MGGFGFRREGNDLNLHTPRMPPHVYRHIREKVHTALRQRFPVVASPIESPGKIDYGDVDVFVCWDTMGRFNECHSVQAIRKCRECHRVREYQAPRSHNSLFDYASTCRFFHDFGDENLAEADRKRMRSRGVYRAWAEEFLPTYGARGSFPKTAPSRALVRDDAMKFFPGPRLLRTSKSNREASMFFSAKKHTMY